MNPDTYGRHSEQYVIAVNGEFPVTVKELVWREFCQAWPQKFVMGIDEGMKWGELYG